MLSRRKIRDSYLASLKMFLSTSGGITLPYFLLGLPSKTVQGQPEIAFRCTYVSTLDVKETKGYLNYIDSLGGESQYWFVCMGRVAEPETLSKTGSPDA